MTEQTNCPRCRFPEEEWPESLMESLDKFKSVLQDRCGWELGEFKNWDFYFDPFVFGIRVKPRKKG